MAVQAARAAAGCLSFPMSASAGLPSLSGRAAVRDGHEPDDIAGAKQGRFGGMRIEQLEIGAADDLPPAR